jgi:hypothetical protein
VDAGTHLDAVGSAAMTAVTRTAPALAGAALLLIVLSTVVEGHYLQIEWQTTAVPALAWWYTAEVAGVLAGPVFVLTVGLGLGAIGDRSPAGMLRTRVMPNLLWYAVSVSATLAVLWRYGPVYGLPPVRDLPELLRLLLLPPAGLALTYVLALFPLLARAVRGLPAPLVLAAAVTVAVLAGAAAVRDPALAAAAGLTRHLLFFLIGWCLGRTARNRAATDSPPPAGALAAIGGAAAPIAALAVPVTAAVGAILVRRLSTLDGPLQTVVSAVEPVLIVGVVVAAGLVGHRLRLPRPRAAAR